jgi:exopolysaccharide biosynthesis polyprenyl glycosylphosphotransferase
MPDKSVADRGQLRTAWPSPSRVAVGRFSAIRLVTGVYPSGESVSEQEGRIDLDRLDRDWVTTAAGLSPSASEVVIRRAADVAISLVGAVLTLPLLVMLALIISLDSPGPVLYRQKRVGLGGRVFTLLKFRTMRVDAEASGPTWAAVQDNRVTRVGGFLRRARLDELPQLFNVLRGEMSFVGPRPERPHFVEQLAEVIPFYHDRTLVKPGITGWAQVNFPYGASVEDAREKLRYDLYYVKHRGLLLDLSILAATIKVVLRQQGGR